MFSWAQTLKHVLSQKLVRLFRLSSIQFQSGSELLALTKKKHLIGEEKKIWKCLVVVWNFLIASTFIARVNLREFWLEGFCRFPENQCQKNANSLKIIWSTFQSFCCRWFNDFQIGFNYESDMTFVIFFNLGPLPLYDNIISDDMKAGPFLNIFFLFMPLRAMIKPA